MDTAALKASWGNVVAAGDDVPLYFYSHLFLHHPELREMFPLQMTGQRDKLVTALGAVISNVDELDKVVPLLEQLGRDHRRFSVETPHYEAVGASLVVRGTDRELIARVVQEIRAAMLAIGGESALL